MSSRRPRRLLVLLAAVTALAVLLGAEFMAGRTGAAVITLDSSTTYQTIKGWEPVAELGDREFAAEFMQWRDKVIDLAVNELGINRVRLELRSGSENPVDSFSRFLAGDITFEDWKRVFYEVINDNADPGIIDPSNFHFSELDHVIANVVLPLKNAVEANGERLFINLCVVDFGGVNDSNVEFQDDPAEYAEFVLAAFQHMQSTHGWVPDGVEVVLEPDNSAWSGTDVGEALVAAGDRLAAAGFSPDFTAPSNAGMGDAIRWFDDMVQNTDAERYLTELSYHRYARVSDANLQTIAARGQQYGLETAMLEHIGSGVVDLVKDLKLANVSSWQQFGLAFPAPDNGGLYIWIDLADPTNPRLGVRSKYLRQYFRYVRRGAVRIAATTDNPSFDPVAFINPGGRWVVVVKATLAGTLEVSGLPAGTYGINYTVGGSEATEPTHDGVDAPSVTIGDGESLGVLVPESGRFSTFGAITVYRTGPGVTSAIPCADVKRLRVARCRNRRLRASVVLRNRAHSGKSLGVAFDDEVRQVRVDRRKAKVKACCFEHGQHSVELVEPAGCAEAISRFCD